MTGPISFKCSPPCSDPSSPEYVATRWYRAPEVMLTFKEYTRAIDMWSVGCVLAEMLSGKPLFPGRDYHHQLSIILDVLGTPSLDDFYAISSHRSREYIRALPFRKKKAFASLFPTANPLAIDLLEQLLTFSPKNRIDVEGALAHPYLEVRCPPLSLPHMIWVPLLLPFLCLAQKINLGSFSPAAVPRSGGRTNSISAGPQLLRFRLSNRSDQGAAQRYTLQHQHSGLDTDALPTVLIYEEITRPQPPRSIAVPDGAPPS